MANETNNPTFKRPDEQARREADPYADQRAYQNYWEQRHRLEEAAKRNSGLSIYEKARLYR